MQLYWAGRYEEAIQSLKRTIRLDPKGPPFYFLYIGNAYRCLEQNDEAITKYKEILGRQPDHMFAHLLLAGTYAVTGREEEAHVEATEVLKLNPKFSVSKLANSLPHKDKVCKERVVDGWRKVGLPE